MSTDPTSYELPPAVPFANEGKTVAGWTLTWGVALGVLVFGIGMVMWEAWVLITGGAIVLVALIASQVLRAMGFGQRSRPRGKVDGDGDWYA
ncbi:MAG TPA: HGxxPAAW family protein [Actinomycetaceae bacterium]|nr:HGxxPAAW family protein [Actinomycetaceae bacterium]